MEKLASIRTVAATRWLPLACVAFALVAGLCLGYARGVSSAQYYATELASLRASETISVNGHAYRIENGSVSGVPAKDRGRVLRTAYALELARRFPLMNISGTDPTRLRDAAGRLAASASIIANLPRAPGEEHLDRATMIAALYPTRFLESLAESEQARQAFLKSGTEESSRQYDASLERAVRAGQADIRTFKDAFMQAARGKEGKGISDVGGTIALNLLVQAIDAIEGNFSRTQKALLYRRLCLQGFVAHCDARGLDISFALGGASPPLPAQKIAEALSIRGIFAASQAKSSLGDRIMVITASSTCLSTVQGPYFFSAPAKAESGGSYLPYFLGDIFFTSTKGDAPTINYLRDDLGMSYSFVNPLTYYRCPDVGIDISNVYATNLTRRFIKDTYGDLDSLPGIPAMEFGQNLDTYLAQADAERFLRYALEHDPERKPQVLELLLAFKNRSAGLDRLAENIADIQESHLRAYAKGLSADFSLQFLFLVQSAFPSLFQAYNPSFLAPASVPLRSGEADDRMKIYRYSELRATVPTESIVHDLKGYFSLERPE